MHGRTKILKVEGLKRDCNQEFLDEKINCKSSGIDLADIESHFNLQIMRPGK